MESLKSTVKIRSSKPQDWPIVWKWMEDLDWINIGRETSKLGYEIRNFKQIVAIDDNDDPISYLAFTNQDTEGFVCAFITAPMYRGKGIGSKLWLSMMQDLNNVANIGVGSAGTMTEKYRDTFGFRLISPLKLFRFSGSCTEHDVSRFLTDTENGIEIRSIQSDKMIEKVVEYDEKVTGVNRGDFLWPWLRSSRITIFNQNPVVMSMCAFDRNGKVVGYGSFSLAMKVHKLGPVYAHDVDVAIKIFCELITEYRRKISKTDKILINVPSTNAKMIDFVEKLGFEKVFELNISYTNSFPEIFFENIYCTASHIGQLF